MSKQSGKRQGKSAPDGGRKAYKNNVVKSNGGGKNSGSKAKGTKPKKSTNSSEIRLNKYIANSGVCSRRDADVHIATGLVSVNGKIVTEMGYKVKLEDEVRYDGARINPEKKAYVLLNKPKGFATTTSEHKGKTVMDLVANATSSRIKPIGRLGRNSTGLLLFTNDEKIVSRFTSSNKGVERLFHLELDRNLKIEDLRKIREGLRIEGKQINVEEIDYVNDKKNEVGIKIKNTGNTILHTIFDYFKHELIKIDCVQIAHLTKKDIPRGNWKILTEQEVQTLMMM
ncbi:23S rRNA pseudouridine2605 synthase [Lacinutrix venerupis]|uniref:Pseudouridylate synthase n=1 Tax=Lacinutrix venerupis TaxID=1486034 RepID=A0AAC9LMU1_9FLAO|nr:pseudouridine synthase [Lacinutrix venerupis]APY01339.1 pseudouridylate synthase [Lacinutrix venerupis]RLJ61536.1 23S rRNA pseudouridine2605 synthase [Lacinutrix venerupis]